MKTICWAWLMVMVLNIAVIAGEFNARVAEKMRTLYEQTSKNKVRYITINTPSPKNRAVNFFYHVPKNYTDGEKHQYRVLIYFGGRNRSGEVEAGKLLDLGKWGDENDIFILSMGFRDDDYWYPQTWSGKALQDALDRLATMYKIKKNRFLLYGYSAGSQCANLFAEYFAKNTVAWVAHGCGVFFTPSAKMRKVPGAVTCGDADIARYIISRKFVRDCRAQKINLIFKSYPNHPHDVPPDSVRLAKEFLLYHHLRNIADLKRDDVEIDDEPALLVGDDVEGVFYPVDSPRVQFIDPADKVYFSTRQLAEVWGKDGN